MYGSMWLRHFHISQIANKGRALHCCSLVNFAEFADEVWHFVNLRWGCLPLANEFLRNLLMKCILVYWQSNGLFSEGTYGMQHTALTVQAACYYCWQKLDKCVLLTVWWHPDKETAHCDELLILPWVACYVLCNGVSLCWFSAMKEIKCQFGSTVVKVSCALSKKTQGESGIYATWHIAFSRWPRKMRREVLALRAAHASSWKHAAWPWSLCACFPQNDMYMKRKKKDVLILVSNISLCYLNFSCYIWKASSSNTAVCWLVVSSRNVEQLKLCCDIPSSISVSQFRSVLLSQTC